MRTQTHFLELRPDFEHDSSGAKLERLLTAQAAYAHATARRSFLAHVAAVFGIPLWLFAAGIGPYAIREAGLLLFPVFVVGFVVSAVAESWWSRRLRAAEREIDVRPRFHEGA